MKFRLEVDLESLTGDAAAELGRILRYWGGAAKQIDLTQPQSQDLYDSTYSKPVGRWSIEERSESPADSVEPTDTTKVSDAG